MINLYDKEEEKNVDNSSNMRYNKFASLEQNDTNNYNTYNNKGLNTLELSRSIEKEINSKWNEINNKINNENPIYHSKTLSNLHKCSQFYPSFTLKQNQNQKMDIKSLISKVKAARKMISMEKNNKNNNNLNEFLNGKMAELRKNIKKKNENKGENIPIMKKKEYIKDFFNKRNVGLSENEKNKIEEKKKEELKSNDKFNLNEQINKDKEKQAEIDKNNIELLTDNESKIEKMKNTLINKKKYVDDNMDYCKTLKNYNTITFDNKGGILNSYSSNKFPNTTTNYLFFQSKIKNSNIPYQSKLQFDNYDNNLYGTYNPNNHRSLRNIEISSLEQTIKMFENGRTRPISKNTYRKNMIDFDDINLNYLRDNKNNYMKKMNKTNNYSSFNLNSFRSYLNNNIPINLKSSKNNMKILKNTWKNNEYKGNLNSSYSKLIKMRSDLKNKTIIYPCSDNIFKMGYYIPKNKKLYDLYRLIKK